MKRIRRKKKRIKGKINPDNTIHNAFEDLQNQLDSLRMGLWKELIKNPEVLQLCKDLAEDKNIKFMMDLMMEKLKEANK